MLELFRLYLIVGGMPEVVKQYIDIDFKGEKVRIGGIYGYVLSPDKVKGEEQFFMEEFQDSDRFKFLLSHMPKGLLLW